MSLIEFQAAIDQNLVPAEFTDLEKTLWFAKKNNWEEAHRICVAYENEPKFDRIHAFLHRQEGDKFNAKWWYNKLKINIPTVSLEEELEEIIFNNLYNGNKR